MKNPDKWASTFPHLYELYCEDPSNPTNYFNCPNLQSDLQEDPPDPYLTDLESILEELDLAAWQEWKGRAACSLSVEKRFGFPVPLFDCLNEARAYVFLKRHGYIEITFLKPERKRAKKTPDLLAKNSDGRIILLEAKRVHDSDDEIEYLVSPLPHDMRVVCHGLSDGLSDKLRSVVEEAREQLLAFVDDKVSRRIVYLSIRIDSQSATQRTRDEIGQFLAKMGDDSIEIVHFIENKFLL
jgi:hypothetical protein